MFVLSVHTFYDETIILLLCNYALHSLYFIAFFKNIFYFKVKERHKIKALYKYKCIN